MDNTLNEEESVYASGTLASERSQLKRKPKESTLQNPTIIRAMALRGQTSWPKADWREIRVYTERIKDLEEEAGGADYFIFSNSEITFRK